MRVRVVVIFALLVVPQVAGAGGLILETKLSETRYGADLGRHVETPDTTGDGGLVALGWWHGRWDVSASLMGHDVVTVNGAHDDNLVMAGVDVRRRIPLASHLDLTVRGGAFHAGIYGVDDTPLEHYRGAGVRLGGGLRFRTVTCGDAVVSLTAELVRNEILLHSDGAKDLRDHTTHVLVGIEYAQVRDIGRRCVW